MVLFHKKSTHHFVCMYVLIKGGLHRYNIEYLWQNQFTTIENINRFFVLGARRVLFHKRIYLQFCWPNALHGRQDVLLYQGLQ